MSLCRGLQNAARLQLGVIRQPVVFVWAQQARRLSTFPLTSRIPRQTHSPCGLTPFRRDYWWSSKSVTLEPTTTPITEANASSLENLKQEPVQSLPKPDEVLLDDSANTLASSEPPLMVDPGVSAIPDISSISVPPPPLQLGDLKELGFSNFTPVGAVQAALEFIQVTTGLPWWGTIVFTTVLTRLVVLHFAIGSIRATAAMAPVRPQLEALMAEAKDAKLAGDNVRGQVASLKIRDLYKEVGTGPVKMVSGPLFQAVTSVVMFIGIKKLCDFPLAQLKYEGVAWLPNLADADPYYILPVLSVALMNLQIYLGRMDMATAGSKALHFSNVFPILSLFSLGFLAHMPAGLLIYLSSNILLISAQSLLLRNPAVRQAFKIPPLVRPKPEQFPSMKDTWTAIKEWYRESGKQSAILVERKARVPAFPVQSSSPTPPRRTPIQRNTRQSVRGRKA